MFTGLIEAIGTIEALDVRPDGARCTISASTLRDGLALGDSVAVDGACLTVAALTDDGFVIDAVTETLERSVLGERAVGASVNLERALRAGDRLGGHIVQGHVDGTGTVAALVDTGTGSRLAITAPNELMRYVVEKGSITVDGVSLTVAGRGPDRFEVALIPHTLDHTTLGAAVAGRRVNLEVDVVAKYVEALVAPYRPEGEHV